MCSMVNCNMYYFVNCNMDVPCLQDPIFGCMPFEQALKAAAPIKKEFDTILAKIQQKLIDLGVTAVHTTNLKGAERGKKKVL